MDYLLQRTNLSMLAVTQLGLYPDVSCTYVDLWNVDQTADTISRFQPNIIFCSATLQPWMVIAKLPKPFFEKLYQVQLGPWLPLHLTPLYKLMQAVQQTGLAPKVINASYPDVVNPVLSKAGLAPTTGIGDLANNVPALRKSIALKLDQPLERVEVRFVAQHQLSHRISRWGTSGGMPFHLTALINGQNMTHLLDMETIFELLPTKFKRLGGTPGYFMTAASAVTIFEPMVNNTGTITHAPGPNGLPGGYPVQVSEKGVEVILPDDITIEQAIELNEDSQRFDGIEKIDENGTVYFTDKGMSILRETLGYECKQMPISETEERAKELRAKYLEFARKYL